MVHTLTGVWLYLPAPSTGRRWWRPWAPCSYRRPGACIWSHNTNHHNWSAWAGTSLRAWWTCWRDGQSSSALPHNTIKNVVHCLGSFSDCWSSWNIQQTVLILSLFTALFLSGTIHPGLIMWCSAIRTKGLVSIEKIGGINLLCRTHYTVIEEIGLKSSSNTWNHIMCLHCLFSVSSSTSKNLQKSKMKSHSFNVNTRGLF